MTLPRTPTTPHLRITAMGKLGTSNERFSWGVNLVKGTGAGLTRLNSGLEGQAWFTDTVNDIQTFHSRALTRLSQQANLDSVKFAFIGADGLYDGDPFLYEFANLPGGGGGSFPPFQIAVAVSLVTARRGATGRGRFYLPLPVVAMDFSTGGMSVTDQNAINQSAQQFLEGLGNEPGFDVGDVRPAVISSRGYASIVTGVRVGRVLDTIRSRRAQLDESYSSILPVT